MSRVNCSVIPRQLVKLQNRVTPDVIRQIARQTNRNYSDVKTEIAELRNLKDPLVRLLALQIEKSD